MKNYILMFLLMLSTSAFADVSGGVGYSSDYFFRGVSQTQGQPSASVWLDLNNDQGVYAGVWAGEVDYSDNPATLESNLYLGYGSELTDKLSYDLGIIQYRYNHGYNDLQEVFVGLGYNNVSLYHYVDTDTHADFTSVSYNLWFVPVVDASISYGYQSRDADHVQLDIDYAINDDFTIGLDVMEEIIEGAYKVENTIALGISYNF